MLVKHAFKQILIATREHWDRLETRPAVRDNFLRMIACGTTALRYSLGAIRRAVLHSPAKS